MANFASPIQSAALYYRVNGGLFSNPVTMVEDPVTGTFSATIPGQTSPAVVEYYLTAEDSMAGYSQTGQSVEYPVLLKVAMDATADQYGDDHSDDAAETRYEASEATPTYRRFLVGVKDTLFSEDFESGSPTGWTHDGAQDGWEFGVPTGATDDPNDPTWSDPGYAYSGSFCAGIDLGTGGSDGAYSHGADNWLRTRTIQVLDTANPTFLRFQRWLSIDDWTNSTMTFLDFVEISVISDPDGMPLETIVWRNHRAVRIIDNVTSSGDWVEFEVEITDALQNQQDEIQILWRLRADPATSGDNDLYGGGTIDDVEIYAIKPVP